MNTSERQALLSAFRQREAQTIQIHCQASGIAMEMKAPCYAQINGLAFDGMSPFASIDTCMTIAKQRYSESHCRMAPTVLAGITIVLLDHYGLRKDKLSTTEANLILSRVPPFELSQALTFLSELPKLSQHKRQSVPSISLSALDYRTLSVWRQAALVAINTFTSTPEITRIKRLSTSTGKLITDSSVTSETIKEARELLKQLREDGIINNKLNSILTVVLQKNNLAMIAPSLRNNLLAAMDKLGTPNCLALAKIIKDADANKTNQEKAITQDFNTGHITNFPPSTKSGIDSIEATVEATIEDSIPSKPLSLLDRIRMAKKQEQRTSAMDFIAMAHEVEAEIESEQEIESEYEPVTEGTSPTSATEQEIEKIDEIEDSEADKANEEESDEEPTAELREELDFSDSFMRIFDETPEHNEGQIA